MKSILENRPALAAEVDKVAEVAGYLWQKGWAERNGGNITVNITEHVDDVIRAMAPISGRFEIGTTLPRLKGCYFFCKGTNKRMRDLARRPMENGSVIRILDDCASYEIIADKAVKPTSELASHLAMHNQMIASGPSHRPDRHDAQPCVPRKGRLDQPPVEHDSRDAGVLPQGAGDRSL